MKRRHSSSRSLLIVRKFFPKVTRVVDATEPITVEVTKGDERASKKRDLNHCAMAVACKRSMVLDGVVMAMCTAYLIKGRKATRYKVPESVQREIVSFDRGAGFSPGEYRLRTPDHPMGREVGGNSTSNGKAREPRHWTEGVRAVLGGRRSAE